MTSGLDHSQIQLKQKGGSSFGYDKVQLKKIIDLYKERKYVEDIDYIQKELGGVERLLTGLHTDLEKGIPTSSCQEREDVFGTHKRDPPGRSTFCQLVKEVLADPMLKLLIGCAFFQLLIELSTASEEDLGHAWIEGFAILLAVAIVSLVGAGSDYQKEGQFMKQQAIAEEQKIVSNSSTSHFITHFAESSSILHFKEFVFT